MTDEQKLRWQIAATIASGYVAAGMIVPEDAAEQAMKLAEMLRLMVVGDWKGGTAKPAAGPRPDMTPPEREKY